MTVDRQIEALREERARLAQTIAVQVRTGAASDELTAAHQEIEELNRKLILLARAAIADEGPSGNFSGM